MNCITSTKTLDSVLTTTPVLFEGDPLWLLEIDDFQLEKDVVNYVKRMDSPGPLPLERTVILGPSGYYDRWPSLKLEIRSPDNLNQFNHRLFERYDRLSRFAFTQGQIADRIEEDLVADIIVLLLFDGLSYCDWINYPDVQSCLVQGPTITENGFRRIIGHPTIASRLFKKGFKKRRGYSYWNRENELADDLFFGFDSSTQMVRVAEFKEVLSNLSKLKGNRIFVQIITNGLDVVSHNYRDRPPVSTIASHLYNDILGGVIDTLSKIKASALIYVSSDHGILWKPEPDVDEKFISLNEKKMNSNRFTRGSFISPYCKEFSVGNQIFSCLKYPYVFKMPSVKQWGIHGGISFQESIVPFLKIEVS